MNLYIIDDGESRLRKVTSDSIINTIAGIDTVNNGGYNGDNILATKARLDHPSYVTVDTLGNIYISDQGKRIRKINTKGIITTIAGTGKDGYSCDGGLAVKAKIGNPFGIVLDKMGNIYFTDIDHNVVRKVDKNGIISTIAGNGTVGYTGDGGLAILATLNYPVALAITNDGSLFIADTYNDVVRKVDVTGIITTVAGVGLAGFSGDGGLAKNAKLNLPAGVAFDNKNNLIIADYGNARIRKVSSDIVLANTFSAFSVTNNNNLIKIDWQTANEINTDYYNLQRSVDLNSFTTIEKIKTVNSNSSDKNYSYVDEDASTLNITRVYYRIQEIGKDGQTNYSDIKAVSFSKLLQVFTVSPNPTKDFINIVSCKNFKDAQIKISDISGKTLFMIKQNFVGGQKVKVSLSQFSSEVLFITIISSNDREQFKIIKE